MGCSHDSRKLFLPIKEGLLENFHSVQCLVNCFMEKLWCNVLSLTGDGSYGDNFNIAIISNLASYEL